MVGGILFLGCVVFFWGDVVFVLFFLVVVFFLKEVSRVFYDNLRPWMFGVFGGVDWEHFLFV